MADAGGNLPGSPSSLLLGAVIPVNISTLPLLLSPSGKTPVECPYAKGEGGIWRRVTISAVGVSEAVLL